MHFLIFIQLVYLYFSFISPNFILFRYKMYNEIQILWNNRFYLSSRSCTLFFLHNFNLNGSIFILSFILKNWVMLFFLKLDWSKNEPKLELPSKWKGTLCKYIRLGLSLAWRENQNQPYWCLFLVTIKNKDV